MKLPKRLETPSNRQPITIDAGQSHSRSQSATTGSGILKTIGITPSVAAMFFFANLLETAMVDATLGLFWICSITLAAPLTYASYVQQRKAGESHHESLSKSLFLGACTAIPVVCVGSLVAAPMGLCGWLAKKQEQQR